MSKDRPSLSRSLTVRQSAALGVAAAGLEAALLAGARSDPVHRRLVARLAPAALPTPAHLLVLLVGVLLVAVAPRLWRGTRAAVRLAVGLLCVVAVLNLVRGFEFAPVVEIGLAAVLFAGRGAFPLGSSNRTHPLLVAAGIGTWALACLAVSVVTPRLSDGWLALIEILIATAVAVSVLAVRALLAPAPGGKGHGPREHRAARAIVWQYGEDSLSPFTLRADKALHFACHGVLAYRVFGETAVISGDPIAPVGAAPLVLASFLALARSRGWQVAVWGASARYLDAYRQLGLRVVQAGEEGFVDPGSFHARGPSRPQVAPVGPPCRPAWLAGDGVRGTRLRCGRSRPRSTRSRAPGERDGDVCSDSRWGWARSSPSSDPMTFSCSRARPAASSEP